MIKDKQQNKYPAPVFRSKNVFKVISSFVVATMHWLVFSLEINLLISAALIE
jgi:hypothetical protein